MFGRKKKVSGEIQPPLKLPVHVAFIMDGNGRWAKRRSLPRTAGHSAGGDNFVKVVWLCDDLGIKYMTVYAFSTENWARSKDEVDHLIKMMHRYIVNYTPELIRRNIKLKILGDLSRFDEQTRSSLEESVATLSHATGMTLCIALNYGGRAEITRAVNNLIAKGAVHVSEQDIADELYTAGLPDPDLIVRTSGEKRLSNFLLWQCAYSELYVTDAYWPDFDREELIKALAEYSCRKRRFGKEA